MYADQLVHPWLECLLDRLPARDIFDAHTHIGEHDPSGFSACLDELLESLDAVDARAAVFPLTEPSGYRKANLACVEAAAQNEHRLAAVVRLTPEESPRPAAAGGPLSRRSGDQAAPHERQVRDRRSQAPRRL